MIGVGNALRGDDAAGVEVARRVRAHLGADGATGAEIDACELQGEPLALLDAWEGRDAVVIVDTMRSGAAPGTVRRLDVSREPLPALPYCCSSTHAVSLGEAIELGRALARLPAHVVVYAVEGRRFEAGSGFSEEVHDVIPALADAVLSQACELAVGSDPSVTAQTGALTRATRGNRWHPKGVIDS